MKILSEMPTGLGNGKWHLAEYGNDFFAWGTELDKSSLWGYPINQCGSKEKVLRCLKSRAELCKKHIEKYSKNYRKDNSDGWKVLIGQEQKEVEAVKEFIAVLETEETK